MMATEANNGRKTSHGVARHDVIQITGQPSIKPPFRHKLAFVDEVTQWGIKAHIETFEGDAHLRLQWGSFVVIGPAKFIRADTIEVGE